MSVPNQNNEANPQGGSSSLPPSDFPTGDSANSAFGLSDPENLPSVEVTVQDLPKVHEPSLNMIGFRLSRFVLWIITGFIVVFLIFLFAKQFDGSPRFSIPDQANLPDSTYARKIEVMRVIQEEKRSYREFAVQIAQLVLLNLLLPVLTAILGYIFASNRNRENS